MEARRWFRIDPPEGVQLEALLEFAAARRARYPTFLLVQRESAQRMSSPAWKRATELFAALEEKIVTEAVTDRWPGEVAQQKAKVTYYRLDRPAALALARVGSLKAFAPPLPEDLCILAADKTPWLVSSASKARFHLHLSDEEKRELGKALPWLKLELETEPPHES